MAALGVLALPVLAMLTFTIFLIGGLRGPDIAIVGLALATGCLALVPLILDTIRPREQRHLLLSLFSLSFVPFFVIPVFLDYLMFNPAMGEPDLLSLPAQEPHAIVAAQLVVIVAMLFFYLGYALPLGPALARVLPSPRVDWSPQAALGVAAVMIPLGWVIFLLIEFGMLPGIIGSGVMGAFSTWTYLGFSLLTIVYLRHRFRPALVFMLAMVPPAMAFNFITGSKGLFLTPPAMVVLSFLFYRRQIGFRFMLIGFAVIVILYPLADFYRWNIQHVGGLRIEEFVADPGYAVNAMADFVANSSPSDWIETGALKTLNRFNGLGILSRIVDAVPDRVPYQGGWTLGYIFISYIPRILWHAKPETGAIGRFITAKFGPGEGFATATGPTWIGDFYMNFGYMGVIPGMLLIGLFFRLLHENIFRERGTIAAFLAGVLTLFITAKGLQSDVLGMVNGIVFNLGLLVLVHMAVRLLSGGVLVAPPQPPAGSGSGLPARTAPRMEAPPRPLGGG
jgi:hypothetical protein